MIAPAPTKKGNGGRQGACCLGGAHVGGGDIRKGWLKKVCRGIATSRTGKVGGDHMCSRGKASRALA